MIGAGIFVFPGLAGGEIGTAATASFAVGGVIALLVALPTSELATAMPRRGRLLLHFARARDAPRNRHRAVAVARAGVRDGFLPRRARVLRARRARSDWDHGRRRSERDRLRHRRPRRSRVHGPERHGYRERREAPERHRRAAALDAGRIPRVRPVGGVRVVAVDTPPGQAADVWEAVPILSVAALVFTSYLGFAQIATVAGDEGPRTESPARDGRLRGDRYGPLRADHLRRDEHLHPGHAAGRRRDRDGRGRPSAPRSGRSARDHRRRAARDDVVGERVDPQHLAGDLRSLEGRASPAAGESDQPAIRHTT